MGDIDWGAIVGISVGLLLTVALMLGIDFYVWNAKRKAGS